jgi:hypothetical protein
MAEEQARFSIVYDGESAADGTIDAKELAPTLLAFADLVDEAQQLTPEAPQQVTLRVRAGFEQGSFEVWLEVSNLYQQFVSIFSGQDASARSNLFQILGISGVVGVGLGLFQLIKRGRGRKTTSVTIERTERVKVTFEGDEPIEVDHRVWKLFNNLRVRKAIERIVQPLRAHGIDTFKIRHRGKETIEIKQDEAPYFEAPTEHEGETVNLTDTRVVIVAPSFQQGNKWRVSDGSRTIFVAIEDPNFVRAVQEGAEAFRKGDLLHVQLQTRQWLEGTELKAEHSILKVYRHESGPEQHKLFPSSSDQSESER